MSATAEEAGSPSATTPPATPTATEAEPASPSGAATPAATPATTPATPASTAATPQTNEPHTFRIGDAVWAKMKGFSAWPGRIELPADGVKRPAMKKLMHWVFFFGTHDYAWLVDSDLKPYKEYKKSLMRERKANNFKRAISEVEHYLDTGKTVKDELIPAATMAEKTEADVEFDALLAKKTPKTPKKRVAATSQEDKPKGRSTSKRLRESTADEDDANSTPLSNHTSSTSSIKKSAVSSFLDRPMLEQPSISDSNSETLKTPVPDLRDRAIEPSKLNFGFLGLGLMGSGVVRNLLQSGHKVTVWNRTAEKAAELVEMGAKEALTPGDVVAEADITFSCVSDPQAAKDMVFGNCGVLSEITHNKGYVEMTGVDADTSHDVTEAISLKGGRYLEAQLQGSKEEAANGRVVILAAGDRTLFDDCQSCFQAIGTNSFYLGDVGNASKMNLVLQLMSGVALAGLAEGMALADRAGLQQKDVLEILGLTSINCPMLVSKGRAMLDVGFPPSHRLQHMQKDLKLALSMGDQMEQPLPLTATANEMSGEPSTSVDVDKNEAVVADISCVVKGDQIEQDGSPATKKAKISDDKEEGSKEVHKSTSAERKKFWNGRIRKMVAPKPPMVVLNELLPPRTVAIEVDPEPVVEPYAGMQVFTARCQYDDQRFLGSGPSRASAKNACAEQCIQYVVAKRYEADELSLDAIPWPNLASLALFKLFHEWQAQGLSIPPELLGSPQSKSNTSSTTTITATTTPATTTVSSSALSYLRRIPPNPTSRHPVQLLYEIVGVDGLAFTSTDISEGFEMSLEVCGSRFVATAKTKKEAKRMVAIAALHALFKIVY